MESTQHTFFKKETKWKKQLIDEKQYFQKINISSLFLCASADFQTKFLYIYSNTVPYILPSLRCSGNDDADVHKRIYKQINLFMILDLDYFTEK